MPKRTCFVICPLGEADSETRKRSDDLFDLVISPALATYEFEVIRADRIPGSGIITNEIISLIQSAELCIVDLTDHNPNVYYECGRRHENDLPFIHMMAESAGALPFDLAGIRTVRYSLEDARRVQAIQNELRRYVDEFERGGYQRIGGASPHEIAASLERIENRLKRLSASLTAPGSPQAQQQIGTRSLRIPSSESALSRVMMEAWFAQDWDSMATLFSAYLQRYELTADNMPIAGILAAQGSEFAAESVLTFAEANLDDHDVIGQTLFNICQALRFFYGEDRETEVIERAEAILRTLDEAAVPDKSDLATFYNEMQKLYSSTGQYDKAIETGEKAVTVASDNSVIMANLLSNYLQLGRVADGLQLTEKILEIDPEPSEEYALVQIVSALLAAGKFERCRTMFDRLSAQFPLRAAMLLNSNDELSSGLGLTAADLRIGQQ